MSLLKCIYKTKNCWFFTASMYHVMISSDSLTLSESEQTGTLMTSQVIRTDGSPVVLPEAVSGNLRISPSNSETVGKDFFILF